MPHRWLQLLAGGCIGSGVTLGFTAWDTTDAGGRILVALAAAGLFAAGVSILWRLKHRDDVRSPE
jgi:hypothetical protein